MSSSKLDFLYNLVAYYNRKHLTEGEQLVATKGACDDEEEYSYFLDNISDDVDVTT